MLIRLAADAITLANLRLKKSVPSFGKSEVLGISFCRDYSHFEDNVGIALARENLSLVAKRKDFLSRDILQPSMLIRWVSEQLAKIDGRVVVRTSKILFIFVLTSTKRKIFAALNCEL